MDQGVEADFQLWFGFSIEGFSSSSISAVQTPLLNSPVRSAASCFSIGSALSSTVNSTGDGVGFVLCYFFFLTGEKLCRQNLVVSKDVCFDWQSVCLVCTAGMTGWEVRPDGVLSPKWERAEKLAGWWKDALCTASEIWLDRLQLESLASAKWAHFAYTRLLTSFEFMGRAWGQSSRTHSSSSSSGSCNWVFPSPNRPRSSPGLSQPCPSGSFWLDLCRSFHILLGSAKAFKYFFEIQHRD